MKVLITGARGMFATDLAVEFAAAAHDVVALDRYDLDVLDAGAVSETIAGEGPDVVIQGAAYTSVDGAESEEDLAARVNADGARNVAEAAASVGALFVYPSTDYVFSGQSTRPWHPFDPPAPVNAYGRSKLAGEAAARHAPRHLIVRTSWLYGHGGANFVETIMRLARERESIDVVDDQIGIPTWSRSLAHTLRGLIERGAQGVLHASDGGEPVSWFAFAQEIVRLSGVSVRLRPIPSRDYPRPATRPSYSVLDCTATEAILERRLPDWRQMLEAYLAGD